MMKIDNLFQNVPDAAEEIFELLQESEHVKIERIISSGQATPGGKVYDQPRHEWVVLLKGKARLHFEEGDRMVELTPGDHVFIPAHSRHRVEWTDPESKTVWLAVHFD